MRVAEGSHPATSWLWALAAFTCARLAAAALLPLTEDESYYRLWAAHLALGYYDHPPMIAWWIAAGERLLGDTALGVRLLPVLACSAATAIAVDTARRFGADTRTRLRLVVWINSAPLIGAGGLLAVPDAAASLFWVVVVRLLAEIALGGSGRLWLALGATLGLALLSKYSAAFLAIGVAGWTLWEPRCRAALRTPWPWVGAGVALAIFAPNIVWNAQHGWITVLKQGGRARLGGLHPQHLLEFAAAELLLFNPLSALFLLRALARWVRGASILAAATVAASAPFAAYLVLHALHAPVQAHWPAPLYLPLMTMAAMAAAAEPSPTWRRMRALVPLGLAAPLALFARSAAPSGLPLPDPAAALRGWRGFAHEVEAARTRTGAGWVGVTSYGLLAQLDHAGAVRVPVVQLDERRRYDGLLPSPQPAVRGRGVVIDLPRRVSHDDLQACFGSVAAAGLIDRGDPQGRATPYAVYVVERPRVDVAREGCRLGKDRRPGLSS